MIITNNAAVPAIGIKLNLLDTANNILLPAYFNDGYFTLLPGEEKKIRVEFPMGTIPVKLRAEGYNLNPTISFLK